MSNSLALILGALILAVVVADIALWEAEHLTFLGRKALALIHWVAFWR